MHIREFDFELPPELIAQEPPVQRGAARLLHLPRHGGPIAHTMVAALPELLAPGDLLVVNDTRVFPARLLGQRVPGGGAVECLLIARLDAHSNDAELWEALMHPGQKLKPGARVVFEGARRIHDGDLLRGTVGLGQFRRESHRHPEPAQQFAHSRSRTALGEVLVVFGAEHGVSSGVLS